MGVDSPHEYIGDLPKHAVHGCVRQPQSMRLRAREARGAPDTAPRLGVGWPALFSGEELSLAVPFVCGSGYCFRLAAS
jgi:hypothetical protein